MVKLNIKLPENFFDEEYVQKYNYTITRFQKEIWAVELDIAEQISKICKKYNLKLYADGGTQLGCVRHNNSFVPWDDDIDFAMFRKDYDIFKEVAKKELKYPYFFQDRSVDNVRFHSIKIRRSDTTAIHRNVLNRVDTSANFGIFVDIFPLDVVPENIESRGAFKNVLQNINKKCQNKYDQNADKKEWDKYYNCACISFNKSRSTSLANLSFPRDIYIYKQLYQYEEATPVKFCGLIDIYLPKDSEETLESQYGNWLKPIINGSKHRGTIYNTNISYKEILSHKEQLIINKSLHLVTIDNYDDNYDEYY